MTVPPPAPQAQAVPRNHFSGSISWANQEQFRLLAPLFEGFAQPRLIARARAVLAAADKDVGVARLSDGGTQWVCPKCERVTCASSCTRNALLGALDALSEALAAAAKTEEAGGVDGHAQDVRASEAVRRTGNANAPSLRAAGVDSGPASSVSSPPAAPWAFSWDDACRRIADDPSVSLTAYEVQELVRGAAPGAVETPGIDGLIDVCDKAAARGGRPHVAILATLGRHELEVLKRTAFKASARPAPVDDNSIGDVIKAYGNGTIILDCGTRTHSFERACAWLAANTGAVAAPPSAERILTQATDVEDAVVLACAAEIAHEAACYSEVVAIIRKHFPAVPSSGGAAVVMPERESLALVLWNAWNRACGNCPSTYVNGPEDVERERYLETADAILAEFRRLNPAPSTASASESEDK